MQIYAVRSSRVPAEARTAFHQMQYDSNYHTQVVKRVTLFKMMRIQLSVFKVKLKLWAAFQYKIGQFVFIFSCSCNGMM